MYHHSPQYLKLTRKATAAPELGRPLAHSDKGMHPPRLAFLRQQCLRLLKPQSRPITCLVPRQPRPSAHPQHNPVPHRLASTSSSTRWKTRQNNDSFAKAARVSGLKSRAAFKLLELDGKHHLFRRGDTVIDLGYAPGSWSQVAVNRVSPGGRVVGIDVIPAQPPRGASSIQGDFLSEEVRRGVREYVSDEGRGRVKVRGVMDQDDGEGGGEPIEEMVEGKLSRKEKDVRDGRVVDVVLSDMSAPWDLVSASWIKSVSNPWSRMMNTSGMPFRDHAGSMVCHFHFFDFIRRVTRGISRARLTAGQDLCLAALTFCYDTLRTGGNFLCKFYQGAEDKAFETKLKKLFERVHREKPESSRSVCVLASISVEDLADQPQASKEAYFVALRRKPDVDRSAVFPDET